MQDAYPNKNYDCIHDRMDMLVSPSQHEYQPYVNS